MHFRPVAYKKRGYSAVLLSAIFFGVSIPLTKILVKEIHPWALAGLLYLGGAVGLLIIYGIQNCFQKAPSKEKSLTLSDWKWLSGAVFLGGVLGPLLLMIGLSKTTASSASLLLNLGPVFTVTIAWLFFKEYVDSKIALGMLFIIIGSCILSWTPNVNLRSTMGIFFIMGAGFCWAIDANFTRKIATSNVLQIALIKSITAGLTNTVLAFIYAPVFPLFKMVLLAGIVGFVGYGLSLIYYILALRYLGAAQTGAYFSLSSFVGAGFAIVFLGESMSLQFLLALGLMGIGVWLYITEYTRYPSTKRISDS